MSIIQIPAYPPVEVVAAEIQIASTVRSTALQGLVQQAQYLAGYRAGKSAHWQMEMSDLSPVDAGAYGTTSNIGALKGNKTDQVAYRVGARAEYLQLFFALMMDPQATTGVKIDVWVETLVGTISVDGYSAVPAMTFAKANGDLYSKSQLMPATSPLSLGVRNIEIAETSYAMSGAYYIPAPSRPTTPRCLNVATAQGARVKISVSQTDCRITAMSIQELFRESVPQ